MTRALFSRLVAVLLLCTAVSPLQAAERVRMSGGVLVTSGGIGEASLAQMKAAEANYNLKLVFTLVEGNYIAGVDVSIVDAAGRTVLRHVAEGPVLLARLPPGRYALRADYEGVLRERSISIGQRLRTEYLRWPADAAADFPLPPEHRKAD
jgi:hypothetical protein